MGPGLILEVLDPRGRVRQRIRLPRHRFTVGRAYDSDCIVDDPYVDPHHLEITAGADGGFHFADRGSANGTWLSPSGERRSEGAITAGLELRVGHTLLRLVDSARPVPPALPEPEPAIGARQLARHQGVALGLVAGALVLQVLASFLGSTAATDLPDLATPALVALLLGIVWAGGWALATRLVIHRFRFIAHLGWAAAVGAAALIADQGMEWIGFLWPAGGWPEGLGLGFRLVLLAALLAGHLSLITEWSRPRRWRLALGIAAGGYLATLALGGPLPSADDAPRHARTLKPLTTRLLPAMTAEEFFDRSVRLQADIDELVTGDER